MTKKTTIRLRQNLTHLGIALMLAGGTWNSLACSPPGGGDPQCSKTAGPSVVAGGAGGDVQVGGGNPINLISGNKYQEETDLEPLPGLLGLELKRYYNSTNAHVGLMGAGWHMSYETVLVDLGTELQIVQADGQRLMFQRGAEGQLTLCTASRPQDGQVEISPDGHGGNSYVWRWPDGRALTFAGGSGGGHPLQAIRAPGGEQVTLAYSPEGELVQVRDPQGRQLNFVYGGAAHVLQAIETPLGRLDYKIDSQGRLTQVVERASAAAAPSRTRIYHYEERYNGGHANALTGISVRSIDPGTRREIDQRLSTYVYDREGRAILTTKGEPLRVREGKPVPGTGIEQLEVSYVDKPLPGDDLPDRNGEVHPRRLGRTIITNSLGQKTELRSALIGNHYRLVAMTGAGCSTCGPADMRYTYDAAGQLRRAIKLDTAGHALSATVTEYDAHGRLSRQGEQADPDAKAPTTRWIRRYEYTDSRDAGGHLTLGAQPTLMAQPSVIPGKERVVRVAYDATGNPLTVTEEGFSPVDGDGRSVPQGVPLARTTTYRYTTIAGRRVLSEVDGPLPDGPLHSPADSDITRLEWDAQGRFITSITSPMNLRESFQRDAAGRILAQTRADGTTLRYEYDDRGLLVRTTHGEDVVNRHYDAQGRLVAMDDAAGRSVQLDHDLAGHVVGARDAQGFASRFNLDTEGRLLSVGLYEPGQDKPLRASYDHWDDKGRLVGQLAADGSVQHWSYDERGEVAAHLDGEGALFLSGRLGTEGRTDVALAPDGSARVAWAGFPRAALQRPALPPDVVLAEQQRSFDDFGRLVVEHSRDHGTRVARFDAAGRLVAVQLRGTTGALAYEDRYERDVAGRLLHRRRVDAAGRVMGDLRLRYEGARLVEHDDDTQTVHYRQDAGGLVTENDVVFKDDSGREAFHTALRTRVDGVSGEIAQMTLADGSVLSIERDPSTQTPNAMRLMSATWARVADWLGRCLPHRAAVVAQGWLPSQAIVQAMNFHPFDGVTGFASGNGVQTARKFDSAGRMTAISVSGVLDETLGYGTGPRIRTLAEQAGGGLVKTSFDYRAFGALRLPATDAPASASAVATMVERDTRGRTVFDGRWHYTWTADGQVDTVADGQGRTVARYRYNADGERVSKTITGPTPRTTYFLWQAGRLVAEVEGSGEHQGEVTAQYFYVTEGPRTIPVAKLESAHAVGNTTGARRLLFVHADYRGQPEAMTDEHRQVVWRAHPDTWGFVQPSEVAHAQAVMNLRLPGQYFDEETGLHDNLNRSYDARPGSPLRGRYLSPDPMGYPDGPDAYAYVGGDPVNHADPLGLYQIDMHYYMTFFLAIAAGVPPDIARTIAEATQYVDDNPLTKPVDQDQNGNVEYYESITNNQTRLEYYHFMEDTLAPGVGIHDVAPGNQLMNLFNAASSTLHPGESDCTQEVFFGEALHALGDSYAHQTNHDVPYNGVNLLGLGVGHGLDDSDPDYTFNHWGYPAVIDKVFPSAQPNASEPWAVYWGTNMDRTLAAEQAIYTQLAASPWAVAGKAVPFGSLATVLVDFNSTGESEEFSYSWDSAGKQTRTPNAKVDHDDRDSINKAFTKKFAILDNALANDLGHPEIKVTSKDWGYSQKLGASNRSAQLGGLKCTDYPGVILPAGTCPMP